MSANPYLTNTDYPVGLIRRELANTWEIADPEILDLFPYMRNLLTHFDRRARSKGPTAIEVSQPLTRRESGVLRLIAHGLSNKRIAQCLDIAPETVKSHAKNIFFKLAVQTRAQAVARGEVLGII